MPNKKLFIESIEALKKQIVYDQKVCDTMSEIFDGFCIYDNGAVINQLIKVLAEIYGDKSEWIEYYIYELDFGKQWKKDSVSQDGNNIPLKTPEDLYNLITNK